MAESTFADGVVAGMATNDRNYGYPVYPAYPMYGGMGGYGNGFGGDWIWIIVLFALFGNGGFGGGFGGGYDFPWLLTGQQQISNNTNDGFRDAAISGKLDSISTALCNNEVNSLQTAYENQIAGMNQSFAMQQAFANCCCENRQATADLKYTVATEAAATRAAGTQNTQAILDKLCQLELDGVKGQLAQAQRENVGLQNQLNMATLRESQTAQNAFISQGFANEVDALYNRLSNCPVPSTPVYGRTPIFTCNNGCGCGNSNGTI